MNPTPVWLAYVGSRTTLERNARGLGISAFRVSDGTWECVQVLQGPPNPSFLCLHPGLPLLYAVHGDFKELSSYDIEDDGQLRPRQRVDTWGSNPVHLAFNATGRWLLVANYATGNISSIRVAEDGTLGKVACSLRLNGVSGPHEQQAGSHPHQVYFGPDGRFAYVPDKGYDTVFALRINEDTGALAVASSNAMRAGSGPRHMVIHPERPIAYVVGELDRTITAMEVDGSELRAVCTHSTVPEHVQFGSAAGITFSNDDKLLFVSNRGHDSVAVFPVGADGSLGRPEWLDAGQTPRFIGLSPNGSLLVAREDGDSLGIWVPVAQARTFFDVARTGSPVCVVFRKVNP